MESHARWLHAVSDGLIGLVYFTIPIILRSLARRRADLPFPWMFFLFGAFEAHTHICAQNQELPVIFAAGYSAEMSQLREVQR